jgi:hypothetical protein
MRLCRPASHRCARILNLRRRKLKTSKVTVLGDAVLCALCGQLWRFSVGLSVHERPELSAAKTLKSSCAPTPAGAHHRGRDRQTSLAETIEVATIRNLSTPQFSPPSRSPSVSWLRSRARRGQGAPTALPSPGSCSSELAS